MWHKVANLQDVQNDSMKQVYVMGKPVLLANVAGEFFAIGDTCTHEECSLSTGLLDGSMVYCACHASQFDVTTGKVMTPPATVDEPSYKVKVEKNEIFIEM